MNTIEKLLHDGIFTMHVPLGLKYPYKMLVTIICLGSGQYSIALFFQPWTCEHVGICIDSFHSFCCGRSPQKHTCSYIAFLFYIISARGVTWGLWALIQKLTWGPLTTTCHFHFAPIYWESLKSYFGSVFTYWEGNSKYFGEIVWVLTYLSNSFQYPLFFFLKKFRSN